MTDWPVRATLSALLAYFCTSALLAQSGLVSRAMAGQFDVTVAEVTPLFSWFGGGILAGSITAVLALDRVRTRHAVQLTSGVLALSLTVIALVDDLLLFRVALGVAGTACGVALAAAAFVITRSYGERLRPSALVGTDLCFSGAGIVMSAVVTAALTAGAAWSVGYALIAGVAAAHLLLSVGAPFPDPVAEGGVDARPLPGAVWICGLGLAGYTCAQTTLMLWLPTHLVDVLGAAETSGGAAIGRYWTGMALGQVAVFFVILRLPLALVLGALLVASLVAVAVLATRTDAQAMLTLSLVLGLVSSGLLKLTLTLASLQLDRPPPRLVSVVLMCATAGTAAAPVLSSAVVEAGGSGAALLAAVAGYLLLALAVGSQLLRRADSPVPADA